MSESVWVPTPGVETAANIQKQAAGYCLHVDDPEALERAAMGIRRAIDRLNTRLWNWALTYDDFYFVAGQGDYPLSSWFKAPSHFDVWDAEYTRVWHMTYKPWKEFSARYPSLSLQHSSDVYSCSNVNAMGTLSLNGTPTAEWVALNNNGRVWYFRRTHYPGTTSGVLNVPSEVGAFIQYWTDGYTADAYAVAKAAAAYQRAREQWDLLVRDDGNNVQSDWEA